MLFIFFILLIIFIGNSLNRKNIEKTSEPIDFQLFKTKIIKIEKEMIEDEVIDTQENIENKKKIILLNMIHQIMIHLKVIWIIELCLIKRLCNMIYNNKLILIH